MIVHSWSFKRQFLAHTLARIDGAIAQRLAELESRWRARGAEIQREYQPSAPPAADRLEAASLAEPAARPVAKPRAAAAGPAVPANPYPDGVPDYLR